jgi:hypothetical protein
MVLILLIHFHTQLFQDICGMEAQIRSYPLIVTLEFDRGQKVYFNELRRRYFPNHANHLEAHLTLFHHLPSHNGFVTETLAGFARRKAFALRVSHLVNFGKGVAFHLESSELDAMHQEMQHTLHPFLKRQDQKPLWPHITVQNKVTAFKAQTTLELLQQDFESFYTKAIGFGVWYYIGGPWRPASFLPFGGI